MKLSCLVLTLTALLIAAGCCDPVQHRDSSLNERRETDRKLAQWPNDAAIENGIISQHTLFPYHFVPNSGQLNELGQRDLGVLARHYQQNPGKLNIRRGPEEETIYHSRVANVMELLRLASVDVSRVPVSDGPSGGAGIASEEILHILVKDVRQPPPGFYSAPETGAGIQGGEQ